MTSPDAAARRAVFDKEAWDRFRRYFDLGLIGMATTLPSTEIVEVNDELCRILGYGREELLGLTWPELTHPDDLETDVAEYRRILAGESEGYSIDKRWVHKDGRIVYSIMSAKCVRREDRTIEYFVGLVQDITERKLGEERRRLAEEALAEAQFDLARVMRATTMGELAASIAHEVNQPLAAVIANGHAGARWLAAMPPNMEEANAALERIIDDANRASGVIARIRAFLRREPSPLKVIGVKETEEIIDEVIAIVAGEIKMQQVTVHCEVTDDTPPVVADRIALQQVLLNLVLNAVEAMSAVTDRPRVLRLLAVPHGGDEVLITVSDSGGGLKPEHAERIFDAFFTTKGAGLGMGLTISRSIVESHGGRLTAANNSDGGATFMVFMRAASAPGAAPGV